MYTVRDIETLLTSFGFNLGIPATNENNDIDCYFYPFQKIAHEILLEDQIDYAKSVLNAKKTKRVCFLLTNENNQIYALLLACNFVHQEASDFERKLNPVTKCIFLSHAEPPANWQQLIKTVYPGVVFTVQRLPDTNISIVFTEFIREFMVQGGFPAAIDIRQTYQAHLNICIEKLKEKLQLLHLTNIEKYQIIKNHLIVLFKYAALSTKRQKLPTNVTSLQQAELIQLTDYYLKQTIYQQNIEINDFLEILSINTLCNLLACPRSNDLLFFLEDIRTKQYQQLQQWQDNIKQQHIMLAKSWKNYLLYKAKQTAEMVYQSSWIGLGAELFKWLSDSLSIPLSNNKFLLEGKRFFNKTVYRVTYIVTASSQQANKNSEKIDHLLTAIYLTPIFKTIGGGLGLALTCISNPIHLIKILMFNNAGFKLSQTLRAEKLDDMQASISYQRFIPSNTAFIRLIHLLYALAESIYGKDYHHFFSTLGGITGSISAVNLAQKCFTDLNIAAGANTLTQNQVLALFFISMAGLEIGQLFTDYGFNLFEQLNACAQAEAAFAQLIQEKPEVYLMGVSQCASVANKFSFFKSNEPSLRLTWATQNKKHYESNCQIDHKNSYVMCEAPIEIKELRLKPF